MDPVCCLLGICCPPFSAEQRGLFVQFLADHLKDADKARKIADATYDDFAAVTKRIAALVSA